MALLDLSEVTKAVIAVIKQAFVVIHPALPPGVTINVFPESPAKLTTDGLSFYLYHVQENAQFKNLPSPGRDLPPVKFVPLALNLYYQLSANISTVVDGTDAFNAYNEQLLMGIAMKSLHDSPEIILPAGSDGSTNRCRISLQPITYNEAVHYWTAGSSPIKLAAYYEVTAILLEPEPITSYAGRVLRYGAFVFPGGAPRINMSQNTITVTIPGEGTSRIITLEPAQVAAGQDLVFSGTGFSSDNTQLQLFSPLWAGALVADASWNLTITGDNQIKVTVPETVNLLNPVSTINLIPGMYSAKVSASRSITLPNGLVKQFTNISNQFPFSITPRVDAVTGPVANVVTVTGFIFLDPSLAAGDVDVYAGQTRLDINVSPGFTIPDKNTIKINLPPGFTSGQQVPIRILVAGTESAPAWITMP